MARQDIKTVVNDLRVKTTDIGSYLTVDSDCNVIWSHGPKESAGPVWNYDFVEEDVHIILPKASTNVDRVIAIMRGVADYAREDGSDLSKANAKIIILPHNNAAYGAATPEYDYIQGGQNFYCSSGVYWNESMSTFSKNNYEYDMYSSIMLKAVYNGDGTYGWVIINGVGLWNAEPLKEGPTYRTDIYEAAQSFGISRTVMVQTAGVNTLTTGVNTTDTEFVSIAKAAINGLTIKQAADSTTQHVKALYPQNYAKSGNPETYTAPNTFIVGKFYDSASIRTPLFNEFSPAGVNLIGVKDAFWDDPDLQQIDQPIQTQVVNDATNFLGYVFNDSRTGKWDANLHSKSFSRRLGLRPKGVLAGAQSLGVTQVVITVDLSAMELKEGTEKRSPRALYVMLQSAFDTSSEYTSPYNNVFKVPHNVYSADHTGLIDGDITVLSSTGFGQSTIDASQTGGMIRIPFTQEDIEAGGKFNIVVEFLSKRNDDLYVPFDTLNEFINEDIEANQYVMLNIFGLEQYRAASVSPDVKFGNFAITNAANRGTDGNIIEGVQTINNAYLDASVSSDTDEANYIGKTPVGCPYAYIGYNEAAEQDTSFFNINGVFKPTDNITKTFFDYSTELNIAAAENTTGTMKCRLMVDWANKSWEFNGTLYRTLTGTTEPTHVCSQSGNFSNDNVSLSFYNNITTAVDPVVVNTITLVDALCISGNGLSRLPYYYRDAVSADGDVNGSCNCVMTHYKTVVNPTGYVETLVHYKCGWQIAEADWTTDIDATLPEWDGLLPDNTGVQTSKSKVCIVPCHNKQSTMGTNGPKTFNPLVKRLLPYFAEAPGINNVANTVNYFAINWDDLADGYAYPSNTQIVGSHSPIKANDFVDIEVNPTSSGTLFGNIEVPFDLNTVKNLGYLIVKQTKASANGVYGNYSLVKDSGTNATEAGVKHNSKVEFTDTVVASNYYRYKVIFYTTGINDGSNTFINAGNPTISRYRPSALGVTPTSFVDFATAYNNSLLQSPISADPAAEKDISYIFNRNRVENPMDIANNIVDDTTLDLIDLETLLFETDVNHTITGTKTANTGSTFTFHVYILKETI